MKILALLSQKFCENRQHIDSEWNMALRHKIYFYIKLLAIEVCGVRLLICL